MSRRNKTQVFKNVEVFDTGTKGKSVAKAPDGRVIFLTNAIPGDVVDIKTFKKRKAYYEGKAIAFQKLSGKRTEPICEYFGTCGGCKWQHMQYKHQLYFKQKEVTNNLERIGQIKLPKVSLILESDQHYYYRNKMEFSFSDKRWLTEEEIQSQETLDDKYALGFHIPGMWDKVLDINTCHLQAEPSNAIRNSIKEFAKKNNLTFFNKRQHSGLLRTLMIRTSSLGELMVLIQFFEDDRTKRELLLNYLVKKFPEINSLLYVINNKANDTIYDQEVICYNGSDFIFEQIDSLKFKINAKSFYQTNSLQANKLYKITRDIANFEGDEIVYDLYTGIGTIAQFIAKKVKKVIGVESVPEAVTAAKENAQLNEINNVDFFVGDMKTLFNDEFINLHGHPDVVITDPPRDGMHRDVVKQLIKICPKKIIYISCNSSTQARDLAFLTSIYNVTTVQPIDMFPQTHHVENVVLLEKIK